MRPAGTSDWHAGQSAPGFGGGRRAATLTWWRCVARGDNSVSDAILELARVARLEYWLERVHKDSRERVDDSAHLS